MYESQLRPSDETSIIPVEISVEGLCVKLNATSKGIMVFLNTCCNSEAILNSHVLLLLVSPAS